MKKNYKNCQSCGMPIKKDEVKGTEKDGSKSTQYCSFCYKNGEFVEPNISAEQMEEKVFSHLRNEMHFPKWISKMFAKKTHKLARWNKQK